MPDGVLPIDRDDELDLSGDDDARDDAAKGGAGKSKAKTPRAAGGAGAKSPSETELRRRIDEGLDELVSVVRDFLGSESVADAIESDKKRMAEVLAAHAMKRARVATIVVRLFGKDSAVAALRAFGPTVRRVGSTLRDRRAARIVERSDELEGWMDELGVYHVGPRPAP